MIGQLVLKLLHYNFKRVGKDIKLCIEKGIDSALKIVIVKPKSIPKSKSEIQIPKPGPKSKSQIQNAKSRGKGMGLGLTI